jgi:drug/metabolite transporter (DMT)-like permease
VPTPKVATYAYVNPIVAVVLGFIVLHEQIDSYMLVGTAVITTAVALVTTAKVQSKAHMEHLAEGPPELDSEV